MNTSTKGYIYFIEEIEERGLEGLVETTMGMLCQTLWKPLS
jgi:hypothetical protein